ncbi:unnamed protein product, partial [Ascophyllum nodosum]
AFRLVKRGSGTGGESVVSKTLDSWEPGPKKPLGVLR